MMTGYADRDRVKQARDAGVSEFLVKPITAKGVLDRLAITAFRPRPFVKAQNYIGPDRRRVERADIGVPRRRAADARAANA
jgi:two-component system chemotaxis response regulator CheY